MLPLIVDYCIIYLQDSKRHGCIAASWLFSFKLYLLNFSNRRWGFSLIFFDYTCAFFHPPSSQFNYVVFLVKGNILLSWLWKLYSQLSHVKYGYFSFPAQLFIFPGINIFLIFKFTLFYMYLSSIQPQTFHHLSKSVLKTLGALWLPFNFIFQSFLRRLLSCSNWPGDYFCAWGPAPSWDLLAQPSWRFPLPFSSVGSPTAWIPWLLLVNNLFRMSTWSIHFPCKRNWDIKFWDIEDLVISLFCPHIWLSLSASRHLDWKSFSFRISKALLYFFLSSSVADISKVFLIPDPLYMTIFFIFGKLIGSFLCWNSTVICLHMSLFLFISLGIL